MQDVTGSVLRQMAGFCVSGVEIFGSATTVFVFEYLTYYF